MANLPSDPDDLARVLALAKNGKPNGEALGEAMAAHIRHFADIPDLMGMEISPIDYLVDGMISRKSMTLWAGADGTAKTLLAQKMGLAVAAGIRFLDANADRPRCSTWITRIPILQCVKDWNCCPGQRS